jgi:hypothetical protein
MTYARHTEAVLPWQGRYQEVPVNAYPSVVVRDAHRAGLAEQLGRAAFAAIDLGEWPQAAEAADRCVALAASAAQPEILARGETAAGIVAAVRGDAATARTLLGRSENSAVRYEWTGLLDVVRLGQGIEALTADRYDEALSSGGQDLTLRLLGYECRTV